MQKYPILSNNIQYYPIISNTIQYHPTCTIQYVLSNNIQYYPIISKQDDVVVVAASGRVLTGKMLEKDRIDLKEVERVCIHSTTLSDVAEAERKVVRTGGESVEAEGMVRLSSATGRGRQSPCSRRADRLSFLFSA